MDKLTDLPERDTQKSHEEDTILTQIFGSDIDAKKNSALYQSTDISPGQTQPGMDWKLLGVCICLFVICANPWIDKLICKIPKCENSTLVFVIKASIFAVLLLLAMYMLKK